MGFNEQVRTQQSRASGAGYLSRYGRFCGTKHIGHNMSGTDTWLDFGSGTNTWLDWGLAPIQVDFRSLFLKLNNFIFHKNRICSKGEFDVIWPFLHFHIWLLFPNLASLELIGFLLFFFMCRVQTAAPLGSPRALFPWFPQPPLASSPNPKSWNKMPSNKIR